MHLSAGDTRCQGSGDRSRKMHAMNGQEIRDFMMYLQRQGSYALADLLRDNRAWGRDAAVALIEFEARRRGVPLN